MKVLYIETVENREHREYIQSIANTVSKEEVGEFLDFLKDILK